MNAGTTADAITRVLDDAIAAGATPGAAALVVGGAERVAVCRGRLHRADGARAVDEDTVWDLASLTKLLSTTLLAARAVDAGVLSLDERPWPAWPGVTVEHALRHEAGLPGWRPFYEEARRGGAAGLPGGKRAVVDAVLATPPDASPGARMTYSDLGFIALGVLLEERLGVPLDVAFTDAARAIYGDTGLRFVRLAEEGFHPAVPLVAPTERCPWRRRAMQGQVHDENCFAMGGVAGHAGLFGTLRDVETAARALLELPRTSTLWRWAELPPEAGRRPVGWDRTNPGGSTGDALGPRTVGHLAFTGCSLWIDPDAQRGWVLLTNRIHETREGPEKILALRKAFHRAAVSSTST